MNTETSINYWLSENENVRISCPECGGIYYNDAPTFCPTCDCEGGLGSISLKTFVYKIVLDKD